MELDGLQYFDHGGESYDFRILKNGGFLSKPLDSGKTFFDIYVNTDQIGMGFETDTSSTSIFSDFQTKIWLKIFSCSSITFYPDFCIQWESLKESLT